MYELDHLEAFTSAGLSWPIAFTSDFEHNTQGLRSQRERELIYLDECASGVFLELSGLKVRDVNLSCKWGAEEPGICPTMLESSVIHVRGFKAASHHVEAPSAHICRVLCGEELLSIQGFGPQWQLRHADWREWAHTDKVRLAGNMFDGHVLVAFFTAMFACAPLAEAISLRNQEEPLPLPCGLADPFLLHVAIAVPCLH